MRHRSSSAEDAERSTSSSRASEPNYIDIDIRSDMAAGNGSLEIKGSQQPRDGLENPHVWVGAATDLHISLQIEVGDRNFHLHKFPLLSKSEKLNRLVFESRDTEKDRIILSDIPGGADAFELVAKFLYGGKFELTPYNVAALRCAADYLEMSDSLGDGNLVAKTENYLNFVVMGSWRDSITVLKMCSELTPWAEDLEIVRRCSESIAWKCSTDPHGMRWSFSAKSGAKEALRDWWFHDVCSLSIDTFSKVIHGLTAKGLNQALVAAAVGCYAEKWLQLTTGSDTSTTLKRKEESQQTSFTGLNQDVVAKDAKKAQRKSYRAIVQGVVNLLSPQPGSMSVKLLLKLLRVACAVDAGSFCKTDLAKRIGVQLEKVSLDDLLIPASGESTYDVDIVQQIVEFYLQHQNYANSSPPFSPRSSGTTCTSSSSSSLRSLSSVSSSDLSSHSGSSVTTESASERSVSGSSTSDSSSVRSGGSGSSITSSSSISSSRSGSLSILSTSSETTELSRSNSHASSETSSPSGSSEESVKLMEKKFYVSTEGPSRIRSQLPPTTSNFKLGQLLEIYLEEVARDTTISLGKFITLADLFTEFPRDSDDGIYRAIDTFLRAHPTLTELERKKLCRVIDTGALSLAACVHAASNERLPLRVIVQVLFSEQIKLRNAMTGNEVMIDKEVESTRLPNFSPTTSITESSSDPTTSNSGSSTTFSIATKSHSNSASTSSASGLNPSVSSAASSQLLGGLSMKETLRFVTAEVESLKKAVQEIETVKSRLSVMESLQLEIHSLSSRFQEMAHDYTGMAQQVEDLTRGSKQKSGWSSGWKKVTKSFHSKDHHDYAAKILTEQHKIDTPAPPRRLPSEHTDSPALPALRTSKSEIVRLPKRPEAGSTLPLKQESLPNPKPPKADSKPTHEAVVVTSFVPVKNKPIVETQPVKDSSNVASDTLKGEIPTSTSARPEKDMTLETSSGNLKDRRKDDNNVVTNHPRRRQCRSTSPDYVRSRRHHYDLDSVSVTSTSSCTSTSKSVSSHSDHGRRGRGSRRRRRRDYSEDQRGNMNTSRSGGHRDASLDKHRSRHHHSSVHKSDHSAGHRQHGSDEGPHHSGLHSSEHSHRKHRQKEGSEHYSHHSHHSHHSGQIHNEHHSVDSHPRHTSKDHIHPNGHHRGQFASHHSSHRRKDSHKEVPNKHSSQHRRHQRHHHKEVFSHSDGSSDSGTRQRRR